MSTGLLQQLDDYFSDIDARQPVVTPDRVAEHLERVTPVLAPAPVGLRARPPVWVAVTAAAAAVILVGLIPLLVARSSIDDPAATIPSTSVPPTTIPSTRAPSTTIVDTETSAVGALVTLQDLGWSWTPVQNYPGFSAIPNLFGPPSSLGNGAWTQVIGPCPEPDVGQRCYEVTVSSDLTTWDTIRLEATEIDGHQKHGTFVGIERGADGVWFSLDGRSWDFRAIGDSIGSWSGYPGSVVTLGEVAVVAEGSLLDMVVDQPGTKPIFDESAGRLYASVGPTEPLEVVYVHPTTGVLHPFVLADTAFALYNDDGARLITSQDGTTWTPVESNLNEAVGRDVEWRSVLPISTGAAAIGVNTEGIVVARTADGARWDALDAVVSDGAPLNERLIAAVDLRTYVHQGHLVLHAPERVDVGPDDGDNLQTAVLVSPDGLTWYPSFGHPARPDDVRRANALVASVETGQESISVSYWVLTPPES